MRATGVFGKLPAHGDFLRRDLPLTFTDPWDDWLSRCLARFQQQDSAALGAQWDAAPGWRFVLPAGIAGERALAGVLLPSQDMVGRRFPLTIVRLLDEHAPVPVSAWFARMLDCARWARDQQASFDSLLERIAEADRGTGADGDTAADVPEGWSTESGIMLAGPRLLVPDSFCELFQTRAAPALALPEEQVVLMTRQVAEKMQDVLASQVASVAQLITPISATEVAGLWRCESASHPGTVRRHNEDCFLDRSALGLWVVADGVGGQRGGQTASRAVVAALDALPATLPAAELLPRVRLAMAEVHDALQPGPDDSESSSQQPASTMVALLRGGNHFACLWAGDSRVYLLRDGQLVQLTRDHSHVQDLVDAGQLAAQDAESHPHANIITRAVGTPDTLELDKVHGVALPGDLFLLCSDGLFKALPETRLTELLVSGSRAHALLDAALAAGARDNVTVLTVSVPDADAPPLAQTL